MKIYISRHGQTKWNTERRLQGWQDSPLTYKGKQRVMELALKLKKVPLEAIYTSDQKRAIDTSNIVNRFHNIEIFELKELRELNMGSWEGRRLKEIAKEHGKELSNFTIGPGHHIPPGGESYEALIERVRKGIELILSSGYENVLIIAHGITIKAMFIVMESLPISRLVDLSVYEGGSLTIFEYQEGKWKKLLDNSTEHFGRLPK